MVNLFIKYVGTLPIKGKAKVTLRKGLNVVFAEKVIDDENDGPRNSLGKSTFIRLIDYGLGSTNFLQKGQNKARTKLINHYLLMEVTINNNYFTLTRNLVDNNENYIYVGWVKDLLLKNEALPYIIGPSFDEYKEFIEEQLLQKENYINEEKIISLRKYIPFLIRNQLNGFSNIYQPIGRSEGQQFARFRTEFFSGLSTFKKIELEQELNLAEEKRKQASQDLKTLVKYLEKKESIIEKNPLNIENEIQSISDQISLIKKQLLNRNNKELLIREKINAIDNDLLELTSNIKLNESRILNYQATINNIYKELNSLDLFIKAENFFEDLNQKKCPTCLQEINNSSQGKYGDKVATSSLIKEILNNEINDLSVAIDELRETIEQMETFYNEGNNNKTNLIKHLAHYTEELILELNKKESRLNELKMQHSEVLYLKSIQGDVKEYSLNLQLHKKTKSEIKQKIDIANLEIESNKTNLISIFDKVVRYLYNNTRKGILKFSTRANNIEVDIAYVDSENNIDSGAAAQNVKVIAFDIALLELSLNNSTHHSKFLIHDSPNVNDIDIDIYHRIFTYILELEKKELQKNKTIDFQYIITTISKPDEVLDEHIILQLETGNEGGKLFGFTF